MKKTDVLVIGGSAAGMVVSLTGKSTYPDKKFLMIKKQKDVMVPCGIPYIFGTLEDSKQNIMPVDTLMEKTGVESLVGEVVSIDTKYKNVKLINGEYIGYEKLVLATGSLPVMPSWLKGGEKENVFTIPKDKLYLDEMKQKLDGCKRVAVIGAGFIGVEFSDEFAKTGHEVVLIEKLQNILGLAFDVELSDKIAVLLEERGVKIRTGAGVTEILGESHVEGVRLDNGETISVDAVILSMGYKPNVKLAQESGIYVDESGFIAVDEYMRTHEPDVFAVGD